MSKLERWLPFRFKRDKAESKGSNVPVRVRRGAERSSALAPAPSPRGAPLTPWAAPLQEWMSYDSFFRDPFARLGLGLEHWFGDFSPSLFSPNIDVVDDENALKITAEVPGASKDDVELSIDGGMLVIRGEKRNQEESQESGVYRSERYYGYFERTVPLPEDVDQEHVEATFDRGVLTVRLPKTRKESSARKITIR